MTTALFIKSYEKDFPWLLYALKSIAKFASGFSEIVVVIPEDSPDLPLTAERVVKVRERGDPYLFQQVCKLDADSYTDADQVCYMDSDCIFTEDVAPETFMTGGKPNWLITPMASIGEDARKAWFQVMADALGETPPYEFMRRHPQVIPRGILADFREFMAAKHGTPLESYILDRPGPSFSEFNVCGFYCHLHRRDHFHWINTEDCLPPTVLRQHWSHSGVTPDVAAEMEAILA